MLVEWRSRLEAAAVRGVGRRLLPSGDGFVPGDAICSNARRFRSAFARAREGEVEGACVRAVRPCSKTRCLHLACCWTAENLRQAVGVC